MANKIGVVIAADGEAKFSQAMKNCATGAKNLQKDLRTLKNDFKENANSMEYLTQRQNMLKTAQDNYQRALTAAKSGLSHQKSVYKDQQKSLEDLKKKLDEAKKAVKDYEKAGDTSSKGYKDATKAVDDYSKAVDKQSVELQKSEGKLTQWEHAVNSAQHDLNACNNEINENARYLNEAANSANGCATSIDKFGKEVKEAGDEAKGSESKLKGMLGTIKTGALEKVGHLATQALAKLGQKAIEAAKYVVDVGSTFEASMSKVEALSGATGSELDALQEKALELGRNTQFSASEAAEALSNMALAGWSTQEMLSGIDGVLQLAAAGGMDLATASDTVAGYLAAFNMEASESGKLADVMATAQAKSKTTTDQLAEAYSTCATNLTQAGQEMTTTTALLEGLASVNDTGSSAGTKLSAVMAQITQKMKDGKIAIGDTQVAVADESGAFRDLVDIIADVESATNGMESAERSAALSKTFNRQSTAAMNELLAVGSEQLRTYKHELEQSEGAAAEMSATMKDNLKGDLEKFNSATEGLGTALYGYFSGPLRSSVQLATDMINGITDAITPQQTALTNFIADINAGIDEVNGLVEAAEQEKQQAEAKVYELDAYKSTIIELQNIVQHGGKLDTYQLYQMKTAVDAVKDEVPYIGNNFDEVTGKINISISTLDTLFENAKQGILDTAMANALSTEYEAVAKAQVEQAKAQAAVKEAQEQYNAKLAEGEKINANAVSGSNQLTSAAGDYYKELGDVKAQLDAAEEAQKNANKAYEDAKKNCDLTKKAVEDLGKAQQESAKDSATNADAMREEQRAARELNEKIKENENASEGASSANDDLADSLDESGDAADEAAEKQKEYAKAVKEAHDSAAEDIKAAYESVKQTLESAFDVDPTKTIDTEDNGQTVEQLTRNLQAQLEAWQNYQKNLEIIKEHVGKEIAPEFMQYLIGMGKDGANTLQHIVDTFEGKVEDGTKTGSEVVKELSDAYVEGLNMQDEITTELAGDSVALQLGLKQMGSSASEWQGLSDIVAQKITDMGQAADASLQRDFQSAVRTARTMGITIPEGLAEGIEEADDPAEAIQNAIDQINAAIEGRGDGLVQVAEQSGVKVPAAIKKGIEAGGDEAVAAYQQLLQLLADTNTNIEATGQETGKQLAESQAAGIEESAGQVTQAAEDAASDAADAAEDKKSEYQEAGSQSATQYAQGITDNQSEAVSAASALAQAALASARSWETQWYGVGVNMAQGLGQGIQSQINSIANQGANLVRQALQAAKSAAGIASPSKVWRDQVGKMLGKGTALGIKQSAKETAKAAEYVMGQTLAAAAKYAEKNKFTIEKIEDMWQRIGAYEASRNFGIKNYTTKKKKVNGKETTVKTKKDTETYYNEILSAAKKYMDDVKVLYDVSDQEELKYWQKVLKRLKKGTSAWYDAKNTIKTLAAQIESDGYDKLIEEKEKYVEEQKRQNSMSISNEISYWNNILKQLKRGTEQYEKVEEKIAELKTKIGTMTAANNLLDTYKVYYDMSEKAEMDYWDTIRKTYTAGTKDRIEADEKYLTAKQAYNDRLEQIEKDYLESVEAANKEYADAIEDRKQKILGAFDIFDAFESKSVLGDELLFNIQAQAAGYEEWNDSIEELQKRGIFSDKLMDELTEKGPSEIAAIKALLMLTDDQLKAYQTAYDRREAAAAAQVDKQSADLKEALQKNLSKATEDHNKALNEATKEADSGLMTLASQIKTIAEDETAKIVAALGAGSKAPESTGTSVPQTTTTATTTSGTTATTQSQTDKAKADNSENEFRVKFEKILAAGDVHKKKATDEEKKKHSDLWAYIVNKYDRAIHDKQVKELAKLLGISVGSSVSDKEKTKILNALKKKGYASGTRSLSTSGANWVDELGPEMIIRKSDNAILTRLRAGDSVIPANLTDNLWKWGAINPDSIASGAEINSRLYAAQMNEIQSIKSGNDNVMTALDSILSILPAIAAGLQIDGKKVSKATSEYTSTELAALYRRRRA